MNPLQLAFYKGVGGKHGALQFSLQKPHYYVKHAPKLRNYEGKFIVDKWLADYPKLTKDDLVSREGAVFLEATSATGKNVYDWDNKIVMALSIHDIGKLLMVLEGLEGEMKILHDPSAKGANAGQVTKTLSVTSPKGIKVGTLFSIAHKSNDSDFIAHNVPLSGDETRVLGICLRAVVPTFLAWT